MSTDHPAQVTVVYVEDDSFFASAVGKLLNDAGYLTVIAKDGESGLALIQKEKPKLILLDLILPKMDGEEVLRRLKANASTKDIPVIVLSNLSAEAEQRELRSLGAVSFLVKAMTLPSEILKEVKVYIPESASAHS
ncbi:MAG: response regulator [Minisyncoccia bacterium]|jgi:CheY-like chemotaxis protein